MFQNRSVASRLGASNEEKIDELVAVIEQIVQKFPQHFDCEWTDYLESRLIANRFISWIC